MKSFSFSEFENLTATVQTPTQSVDDMMGITNDPWASKTSVGASGAVIGSLQSIGGQRQDIQGKWGSVVDYIFYPEENTTGVSLIANGDRLYVSGKNYDVIHVEDETGAGLSPVVYLRRID
jgi:hypothetical protein